MMKLRLGLFAGGLLIAIGCAAGNKDYGGSLPSDGAPSEPDTGEAELGELTDGELVGSIACGETKRVLHPGTPTYRALSIAAKAGQILDVRVAAKGHDAMAWLTSAKNRTLGKNDDESAESSNARIVYTATSTETHHIVFREKSRDEDVDFDVTLECRGGTTADGGSSDASTDAATGGDAEAGTPITDPFEPAACTGPQMTMPQAIAKLGAGNAIKVIAPPRKLMARKRSCNTVTGCGAWGAAAPASHNFYMASGGDNYNLPREYDVHLALSVVGTDIEAVVEDQSNRAHCAGCTPDGISFNLATSTLRPFYDDAALFIYYPRWSHTSSGFRLMSEWASVPLGPKTTTTMTVTDHCARASVVSKDRETEYAVLFNY